MSKSYRLKTGFSIGKAARIIGVAVNTLRDWANDGKVPGLRTTTGGHRWVTREGLITLMKKKGAAADRLRAADRRRHPRIIPKQGRIFLKAVSSRTGEPLGRGLGLLKDVSRSGFLVDALRWKGDCVPAPGAVFSFEVKRGGLRGVSGAGRVAWFRGSEEGGGIAIGARIDGFEREDLREAWNTYTTVEVN